MFGNITVELILRLQDLLEAMIPPIETKVNEEVSIGFQYDGLSIMYLTSRYLDRVNQFVGTF